METVQHHCWKLFDNDGTRFMHCWVMAAWCQPDITYWGVQTPMCGKGDKGFMTRSRTHCDFGAQVMGHEPGHSHDSADLKSSLVCLKTC